MSIPRWSFIPDSTMAEAERQAEAEAWAEEQRQQLADTWAERQRELSQQHVDSLYPEVQKPKLGSPEWALEQQKLFKERQQQRKLGLVEKESAVVGFVPGEAFPAQPKPELKPGGISAITGQSYEQATERAGVPVGEALEAHTENVIRPLSEFVTQTIEAKGQPLVPLVKGLVEGGGPAGLHQNLKQQWEKRPELLPGMKGIAEMAIDPMNVLPGPQLSNVGKAATKAVESIPKLGKVAGEIAPKLGEAAKVVGEAITSPRLKQLAPGLGVEDVSQLAKEVPKLNWTESNVGTLVAKPYYGIVPSSVFKGKMKLVDLSNPGATKFFDSIEDAKAAAEKLEIEKLTTSTETPMLTKTVGGEIVSVEAPATVYKQPSSKLEWDGSGEYADAFSAHSGDHIAKIEPNPDGSYTVLYIPTNKSYVMSNMLTAKTLVEGMHTKLSTSVPISKAAEAIAPEPIAPGWFKSTSKTPVYADISNDLANPKWRVWYKGSTVVDEDGIPTPLYHGLMGGLKSTKVKLGRFLRSNDVGFHFGTYRAAVDRAGVGRPIGEFWLNVKNPLETKDLHGWELSDWQRELKRLGIIDPDDFEQQYKSFIRDIDQSAYRDYKTAHKDRLFIRSLLEGQGYDGVKYKNQHEDRGSISYIAFRPEQVKSVGNSDFTATSPKYLGSVPEIGNAIAGAGIGYMTAPEESTEEERWDRALRGAMVGAGGTAALRGGLKGLKKIAPSLGIEDVSIPTTETTLKAPGKAKSIGFEYLWNRVRNIAEKQGQYGKELGQKLYNWRESYQPMIGDWTTRMPNVKSLGKMEFDNFINVVEAKAEPVSDKVSKAATEWREISSEIEQRANASGLDIGHIDNYFPHMFDPKYLDKVLDTSDQSQWLKTLDYMVESKFAKDRAEAQGLLMKIRGDIHTKTASNLEIARKVNLPGYRRDKSVIGDYLAEAGKRIAYAEEFGPKHEKLNDLMSRIAAEGYDKHGELNNMVSKAVYGSINGYREQRLSNFVRGYNVATKLGLGALTNATQPVNIATVGGGIRTLLKTPYAAFNPEAHEFAVRIGAITDEAISAFQEGSGYAGKAAQIGAPFFSTVERFNRTLAAVVGRDVVMDLAKKAVGGDKLAIQGLTDMKLDPQAIIQRGGQLTQQEVDRAARSFVERTQFLVDPQDLPAWASSPLGRMVMQFRTYGYNQTAFMAREVLGPALRKENRDVRPLIRFMIYAPIAGGAAVETSDLIRLRDTSGDNLQEYLWRYYQKVGGLGVLGDVITGLKPPGSEYSSGERYAINLAGLAGGPGVSTGLKFASTIPESLGGKPKNLERFALEQIPAIGPTIRNALLPYDKKEEGTKSITPARYPGRITPQYPGKPSRR